MKKFSIVLYTNMEAVQTTYSFCALIGLFLTKLNYINVPINTNCIITEIRFICFLQFPVNSLFKGRINVPFSTEKGAMLN